MDQRFDNYDQINKVVNAKQPQLIYAIDINACFFRTAYNLKFINKDLFDKWCKDMSFRAIAFAAADAGQPIYHTNVLMSICQKMVFISGKGRIKEARGKNGGEAGVERKGGVKGIIFLCIPI